MSISNKVILIGRLTRDVEVRSTNSGKNVASFTVAVNRPYNKEHEHPEADFFNCVAWEQRADFIAKWFSKGDEIRVCGRLQNREWEKEGVKQRATEVVVEEVEFGQKRKDASGDVAPQQAQKSAPAPKPTQQSVEEMDDELPF